MINLSSIIPVKVKKQFRIYRMEKAFKAESSVPPNHFTKQHQIYSIAQKYNLNVFVETGTYLGDMVSAMRYFFSSLYSIELSTKLAAEAKELFKNNSSIQIVQGDSSRKLEEIINQLGDPALFWLDGHYSGGQTALGDKECPVLEELNAIDKFKHKANSAILIDDARLFDGTNDYPKVETLEKWVNTHLPSHSLHLEHDAICILPKI